MTRSQIRKYFEIAALFAKADADRRTFVLGAVGLRADGVLVAARNGYPPERDYGSHAEARLARKLDAGSVVFVVRLLTGGRYAMAKPCHSCERVLQSRRVERVYYSMDGDRYGSLIF